MELWTAVFLGCGLFAIVRGVIDLRDRRYAWGGLGVIAGLGLLLTPIPTHAVKIDLPTPAHS
ncbi:hypothetical protein [Sphingomonas sp.]|uniref:hypothetical protein n=1 Tax=Sphingomonas sp. TaxID=28214 RepID=UPI0025CDC26C|nr:hypothetical protein [Sphingomonas sp.]